MKARIGTCIAVAVMLLAYAFFLCAMPVFGREVREIRFEGRVSSFSMDHLLREYYGDVTDEDLSRLARLIEEEYHRRGYTMTVVGRIDITEDAVMVIHVHEPLLEGAVVRGVPEGMARKIETMLVPETGESYNRFRLRERLARARNRYGLDDVKAAMEVTDSGNVFLVVDAERKRGRFYGGIGSDLFYGVSPFAGYYHAFDASALDVSAGVGIDSSGIRRARGDFFFYSFGGDERGALFAALHSDMTIDIWESRQQQDYRTITVAPSLGYRMERDMMRWTLSLGGAPVWIGDYGNEERSLYADGGITLEGSLGRRGRTGTGREDWYVKVKGRGGYESLNDIVYADAVLEAGYPLFPVTWLRVVPACYGFAASSSDRIHLAYVFNEHLLGFFDDFTAARVLQTAGLDLEFEVSQKYLFMGPFIDGGLFLDEEGSWDGRSGTGLRVTALYGRVILGLVYAWDVTKNPGKGGVYFSVSGSF